MCSAFFRGGIQKGPTDKTDVSVRAVYRHERGAKPMQCESLRAGCMFGPRYVNGEITCECLTGMEFLDGGELFQGDIQLSEVSLEYIEYTFEHFVSRGDVTVKPRVFLPQGGQDGAAKRMVPFVVEALDRSVSMGAGTSLRTAAPKFSPKIIVKF